MKATFKLAAALTLALGLQAAHAQFGGASMLSSLGGGKPAAGSAAVNPADLAKSTLTAMTAFTQAQLGLAKALGDYPSLAADQARMENLAKSGDSTVSQESIETTASINASTADFISKQLAAGVQLSAANRAAAGKAMVAYVRGLAATKNVVASLQSAVKNPLALGSNASVLVYSGSKLPGIVSSGVSTTGTLFQYMTANGVDMTEAKQVANKELGV